MRDRVQMKLGAKEYALLPAFAVIDAFEDQHYSLLEHLDRLMKGTAVIHARAFLICEGLKAADPEVKWDVLTIMERMFERGYWHESLVFEEQEFIERLLYTPEQYLAKKQQRVAEAEQQKAMLDRLLDNSSE